MAPYAKKSCDILVESQFQRDTKHTGITGHDLPATIGHFSRSQLKKNGQMDINMDADTSPVKCVFLRVFFFWCTPLGYLYFSIFSFRIYQDWVLQELTLACFDTISI